LEKNDGGLELRIPRHAISFCEKVMGVVARSLMTIELLVSSVLILLLVATVIMKLNSFCPNDSNDEKCKRPFLNGLMIISVVVALFGGGLAVWKMKTKSQAVVDAVSQQINS
jgi:hypothetical protein